MYKFVKEAFLVIMASTVALILYWVFFGQPDGSGWEGALYWASRQIENPIGGYYFDYCLVPSAHNTDYLDLELGCKFYGNKTSVSEITYAEYDSSSLQNDASFAIGYISYPDNLPHYAVVY